MLTRRRRSYWVAGGEPSPEEVAAVRAKAAAAGFPSQTITEEQFQELEEKQQVGSPVYFQCIDWKQRLAEGKRATDMGAHVAPQELGCMP